MLDWARDLRKTTKLRWNRVHKFRPQTQIHIEFGPYVLKTASSREELIEGFRLRHEVFFNEFQGIEKVGLDVDRFDARFDHLLIFHKPTERLVGTYRINVFKSVAQSYTALEFNLDNILRWQGPFLELGRACIHRDHRRGAVISLLWRGIAEYMNQCEAQVLFGCSSLKINEAREAALVYKYLMEQGLVIDQGIADPTRSFQMRDFDAWFSYFHPRLSPEQSAEAEELVPSLLKSYLKLGAKVAGEPAFDRDFDCIDMLTVLRRQDLTDSLARRFQVDRTGA